MAGRTARKFELPSGRGRGAGRGRGRGRGSADAAAAPAHEDGSDEDEPEDAPAVTPEKQRELLQGYIELSPRYWGNLSTGDQIRYYVKDSGEFRYGGIVQIPRFKSNSRTAPETDLMLIKKAARWSKPWAVKWDNILKIYIIPSVSLMVMHHNLQTTITTINSNIQQLADAFRALDKRLQKVEARLGPRLAEGVIHNPPP